MTPEPPERVEGPWRVYVCPLHGPVEPDLDGAEEQTTFYCPVYMDDKVCERPLRFVQVVPLHQLEEAERERDEWKHRGERGEVSGWKGRAESAEARAAKLEAAIREHRRSLRDYGRVGLAVQSANDVLYAALTESEGSEAG